MQPLIWERRPDGLRAPALVCAFKGWNDAGDAASAALQFLGASLGATRFAHDRSRGVLRLPGDPAEGQARSRAARARSPGRRSRSTRRACRARRATSCCWRAPSRRCAGARSARLIVDLAEALGDADGRHARRAARRRAALAARADHRPGLRRGARRAPRRCRARSYEGPTGHRRRAARRLPGGRHAVGEPVGQRAALRRRRAEPEGRARARAQAREPRRRDGRRQRARVRGRRLRAPGLAGRRRATPTCRRSSSAWRRRPRRRSRPCARRTFLPATCIAREFQRFLRQRGPGEGG